MKFEKPRRRSGGRKDAPCSGDRLSGALKEKNILNPGEEYQTWKKIFRNLITNMDGVGVLLGCGGVLYSLCTEMPSTAHAPGLLSTPLAREYVCQKCGKALPPLGIEPLPPAPKARALKGRAIWTLVLSHRYRREVHIQYTLPQLLFPLRARTHYATFFFFF